MEKEPISKERQANDALLILISGGVIGIIGVIVERNIFSAPILDVNAVIRMGEPTAVGLGLAVGGALKYLDLRRSPKNSGE